MCCSRFTSTVRGFIKQVFLMFHGTSLWFGIINVASTFINLRYLLTTKIRSTIETTFWKEKRVNLHLKRKLNCRSLQLNNKDQASILISIANMSPFPIFLLNDSIDDSYHLGFLSTRKFNILFFIKIWIKLLNQFYFGLKLIFLECGGPPPLWLWCLKIKPSIELNI